MWLLHALASPHHTYAPSQRKSGWRPVLAPCSRAAEPPLQLSRATAMCPHAPQEAGPARGPHTPKAVAALSLILRPFAAEVETKHEGNKGGAEEDGLGDVIRLGEELNQRVQVPAGDDKGDRASESSQRVRGSLYISLGVSDALPNLEEAVEESDRDLRRLPRWVGWYAAMQPRHECAARVGGRRGSVQPSGGGGRAWWREHVVRRRGRVGGRSPCASRSAKLKSGGRGG
jgi:hypothetical protein